MLEFQDWAPYGGSALRLPRSFWMSVEHVNVDGNESKVKIFLRFVVGSSEGTNRIWDFPY
jgi:hypothetical protein